MQLGHELGPKSVIRDVTKMFAPYPACVTTFLLSLDKFSGV